MSKSVTTRAIQAASRAASERGLKAAGFRRQGNHLHRAVEGLVHAVNFQGSQWGSADSGSFTVNLGVASPLLYTTWSGTPFPSNPATTHALFPVGLRIGRLMPSPHDHWWKVDEATNLDVLSNEVAGAILEYGLPFFDGFKSASSMLLHLRNGDALPELAEGHRPFVHAILAAEAGAREEAREVLMRTHDETEVASFRERLREIAERLGVPLP